jgi:hypothetical protein
MRVFAPTGTPGMVQVIVGNAAVEITRGDISLDFVAQKSSIDARPMLYISTLSGTASVIQNGAGASPMRIPLYQNETVMLDVQTTLAVVTRNPLNQETVAFWSRNGFKQAGIGTAPQLAAAAGPAPMYPFAETNNSLMIPTSIPSGVPVHGPAGTMVKPSRTEDIDFGIAAGNTFSGSNGLGIRETAPENIGRKVLSATELSKKSPDGMSIELKNVGTMVGIVLTVLGAGIQSFSHIAGDGVFGAEVNNQVFLYSYAPIALGITSLLASYFYKYDG